MKTKKQYLKNECTHSEYYSQFVNSSVSSLVVSFFGENNLIESYKENKHFNSSLTPLSNWDRLAGLYIPYSSEFKEKGDYCTLSGKVCILKQAAENFVNKQLKKQ